MNGPSDEIGPLERLWHNGDFVVDPEATPMSGEAAVMFRRAEPVEDAPIESQAHLRPPDDIDRAEIIHTLDAAQITADRIYLSGHTAPIGATEGDMIYKGLDFEGHPVWERATEDDRLALQAREGIPRSTPKTRGHVREAMRRQDEEREEAERRARSTDPLDRLETYMTRRIWSEMVYDEPLGAQEALDDALAWLRAHTEVTTVATMDATVRVDRRFT